MNVIYNYFNFHRSQERYNESHIKTRLIIEQSFGWLKKRFGVLGTTIKTRPDRVVKIITACAVLHNIALQLKEPMFANEEVVQHIDEFVCPDNLNEGRHIRDYIANTHF